MHGIENKLLFALFSPSMSSDTGVRKMSPVNSQLVFLASMPEVPSNTWNKERNQASSHDARRVGMSQTKQYKKTEDS